MRRAGTGNTAGGGGLRGCRRATLAAVLGLLAISSLAAATQAPDPLIDEIEDPIELQQLGVRYIEANQPDNALRALNKSLRAYRDNAETHMWLGVALSMKGELEQALVAYDRALELNPRLTETLVWRAAHWRRQGELERAVEDLRQALEDPTFPSVSRARALLNLGIVYLEQDDPEAAVDVLSQATSMPPSRDETLVTLIRVQLARALIRTGRPMEAISALEPLRESGPPRADVTFLMATAYRDLGDVDRARGLFEDVLRLAPGSELSREAREELRKLEGLS